MKVILAIKQVTIKEKKRLHMWIFIQNEKFI